MNKKLHISREYSSNDSDDDDIYILNEKENRGFKSYGEKSKDRV
jgi:hypothetical protein